MTYKIVTGLFISAVLAASILTLFSDKPLDGRITTLKAGFGGLGTKNPDGPACPPC